ncbi:FG-GAP-like repeat-containing protein [Planctomycetota bacterium]
MDVDGDGDLDVLSASSTDDTVAWYENDGSQNFMSHTISSAADGAQSVFAADVDGDGDMDVLSASTSDDKITWYENDGSQNFSTHTISTTAIFAFSVFAADVDGDGDTDVLSASPNDSTVAWYENDGSQNFTTHTITTTASLVVSVFAADVDGDGDLDVLSTSLFDEIAWYENDGNQSFTPHTIDMTADSPLSVFAADVDGDGDMDVLSASSSDDRIAWYENDGSQNFSTHTISSTAGGAASVFAADMDGDGDMDVIGASGSDNAIVWYKNDGSQNFSPITISTAAAGAWSVFAADVDGDGDLDVLSASESDDKIAWYENLAPPSITSSATAIVAENQTAVIDVESTDPDGDTEGAGLTYSLTGGADQALFAIEPNTGRLSFLTPKTLNAPEDVGLDNIYDVQVTVTDSGGDIASQDISARIVAPAVELVSNVGTSIFDGVADDQSSVSVGDRSISSDGRFIVFSSDATNLVVGDANGATDIYLKDRQTGVTTLVSTDSNSTPANGDSVGATISADGRYVAFSSDATNLVVGDTNAVADVFVKDLLTGTTTRVNLSSNGVQGTNGANSPSISGDGRYVSFTSSDALVPDKTHGFIEVFVRDLQTSTTTRVSTDSSGAEVSGASQGSSISGNGGHVAFYSLASDLVPGDVNATWDIFVKDLQTDATTLASSDSLGQQGVGGMGSLFPPSISDDGRFVAFTSEATNLVPDDTNGSRDVFVKDLQTGETRRASTSFSGAEGDSGSDFPSISGDGRYVAFQSAATNLVAGVDVGRTDIFVKDLSTGILKRLNSNFDGVEPNGISFFPSISTNGQFVTFLSWASDLVPGDSNGHADVFVAHSPPSAAAIAGWAESPSHTSGRDEGSSVATDAFGNAYVVGTQDIGSDAKLFVSKYGPTGLLEWTREIGGVGQDVEGNGVAVDGLGNVYVVGGFQGTVNFNAGGLAQETAAGGFDIYVLKLDTLGQFAWVKTLGQGSAAWDKAVAVDADANGDIAVLGLFDGTFDFDDGPGVFQPQANSQEMFLLNLDNNGNFLWAKTFGGDAGGIENPTAVRRDSVGDIYVGGRFTGATADFDRQVDHPDDRDDVTALGTGDAFLAKYAANGTLQWVRQMGAAGGKWEAVYGIAADDFGRITIAGGFQATVAEPFDPGNGGAWPSVNGSHDAFVIQWDSQGGYNWGHPIGSYWQDRAKSVDVDATGQIYFAGYFGTTVDMDPDPSDSYPLRHTPGHEQEAYVASWDATGDFQWASRLGGPDEDEVRGISLDAQGNVYVAGYFSGAADFVTGDAFTQLASAGGRDAFAARIVSPGPFDFGDAPSPYPTLGSSNGAKHTISSLTLGASIDIDADGQPTSNADGDDQDGTDDEDGVTFVEPLTAGNASAVDIVVSEPGLLNAWIDFNDDGDWDDLGEQVFTDEAVDAGLNRLFASVPNSAVPTEQTFARFRLSSSGGLAPTGPAADGEVEDYAVEVRERKTYEIGAINWGIAVSDNATGTGFIMYSEESVHTRFAAHAPLSHNSDHLIAVRLNGANWQYNDNGSWYGFTPTAGDRLLASVDFTADTITSLQGAVGQVNGIRQGFEVSDLVFQANAWAGGPNNGEFTVSGTYFDVAAT